MGKLHDIKINRNSPAISYLICVDDLVIFTTTNVKRLQLFNLFWKNAATRLSNVLTLTSLWFLFQAI